MRINQPMKPVRRVGQMALPLWDQWIMEGTACAQLWPIDAVEGKVAPCPMWSIAPMPPARSG